MATFKVTLTAVDKSGALATEVIKAYRINEFKGSLSFLESSGEICAVYNEGHWMRVNRLSEN